MLDNIDKVAQRGEKLDDLGERAGKSIFECVGMLPCEYNSNYSYQNT